MPECDSSVIKPIFPGKDYNFDEEGYTNAKS